MKDILRIQAELLAETDKAETGENLSREKIRQVFHELHVHQIELEIQNEELRRTQVELEAARARYFDLYDLAPVGYCTVSEQGLILEANLTVATMLGLPRRELVGKPWTKFVHQKDQNIYYQRRKKVFETAEPAAYELRLVKKDGTEFWAHLNTTITRDVDGVPSCQIVFHDISQRKQDEQFRKNVESIIQHDIKSPLINLYSLAQLVISGEQHIDIMEAFPRIVVGIRQVIHLINAAEPLRKMENGTYMPSRQPIDIQLLLSAVNDSLAILSSQLMVPIRLQAVAADVFSGDSRLYGEAFLLENMLMNLVKNAVEASPRGGCVTISCQTVQGVLRIAIHNAGVVPEDVRDRFFEKYATSGKRSGTGLGTYSAQLIAKAHGGHIEFTTSEAEGTRVTVVLPCSGTRRVPAA